MARKDWRGPSSSSTIRRVPRSRAGATWRLGAEKSSEGRESGIVTFSSGARKKANNLGYPLMQIAHGRGAGQQPIPKCGRVKAGSAVLRHPAELLQAGENFLGLLSEIHRDQTDATQQVVELVSKEALLVGQIKAALVDAINHRADSLGEIQRRDLGEEIDSLVDGGARREGEFLRLGRGAVEVSITI